MKRSSATSRDVVRVVLVRDICGKHCPIERGAAGDVTVTPIRVGDTVLRDGTQEVVTEITSDYAGRTGTYVVCGRRRQMAAALLILSSGAVCYIDSSIQKICPDCGRTVVGFQ